ncbi:sulfatase-like hydrolase/transferase [Myxococcota bacterium]|nr:sulfatase-like hydrolase/transferase [Myxococcota bacterium]
MAYRSGSTRRALLQGAGALSVVGAGFTLQACRAPSGKDATDDTEADDTGLVDSVGEDSGGEDSGGDDTEDSGVEDGPVARSQLSVLYISSDEHNPKALGFEGHPDAMTPNLDRLAAEGMVLNRVYTTMPVCAPTRQSLLTGLWPQEHGQLSNAYVFNELNWTLAEHFTEQGFATACFGKLHTQNDEETHSFGFQSFISTASGARWDELYAAYVEGLDQPIGDPEHEAIFADIPFSGFDGHPLADPRRDDDYVLLQEAIAWLRAHKDERFFLYVSFRAPHYPWRLPNDYYYRYDPAMMTLPENIAGDLDDCRIGAHWVEEMGWDGMTEEQSRLCLALYMGAVSWIDTLVGELLAVLEELGLSKSTAVVYTSDHGDMLGEKGLWLKSTFFEGAARKPFIVRAPGHIPPGTRSDAMLSEIDLWPSLAGLIEANAGLESLSGQDHSGVFLGETATGRDVVLSMYGLNPTDTDPWLMMARDDRYKLVRYRTWTWDETAYELYDLSLDPTEIDNIHDDPSLADKKAELSAAMDACLAGMRDSAFPPVVASGGEDEE